MDAGKDISLFHSEWKVSESVRLLEMEVATFHRD